METKEIIIFSQSLQHYSTEELTEQAERLKSQLCHMEFNMDVMTSLSLIEEELEKRGNQ